MVIHGLLDTCSYVFKMFVCFSSVIGFEKVSLKDFWMTFVSVLKSVWKKKFESFWKCQCEKIFNLFLKRASIHESSTYPKELGCVKVLKVVQSHHWEVGSTTVGGVRVNLFVRDNVVTRATVGHLRGGVWLVCRFQIFLSCHALVIYALLLFWHSFFHAIVNS